MAHAPTTAERPAAPLALHGQSVEGVDRCVHCGLCLAYCPTFSELGTEMDSPRGRIVLIKSLAEGRIGLTDSAVAHLDLCLGCRACETVCPSGVPYGQLIETARSEIERQRPGGSARDERIAAVSTPGGALAATDLDPIAMLFWTAVINGVVADKHGWLEFVYDGEPRQAVGAGTKAGRA